MRRSAVVLVCVAAVGLSVEIAACGSSGDVSTFTPDGSADDDGSSNPPVIFGDLDGGVLNEAGDPGCDAGCPTGYVCAADKCIPQQGTCAGDAGDAGACAYDTYCDAVTHQCVPFGGAVTNDPQCKQLAVPGNFAPKTKCQFPTTIPIPGDPFPNHVDVQATPMVVRFGNTMTPPSIIANFTQPVANSYTENLGVLRILKGTDCTQEAVIGGVDLDGDSNIDWTRSSSPVAIGDLDLDGVPDIVAYTTTNAGGAKEQMMAFSKKTGSWAPLWTTKKATLADGSTIFNANISGGWAGPSIHDLDDDGKPEIIREGWVFDGATGKLIAPPPGNYASYSQGIMSVLGNMDADAKIEMTNGARMWEFDPVTKLWVDDAGYLQTTPSGTGWTAIADFDPANTPQMPEIAVARNATLTIFKNDHSVFMNMLNIAVPGGGGGPPTIADFDGDGLPEVALAGQAYYTVYDPDCQATPRPGGQCTDRTHCEFAAGGNCPNYVLWSRASQDVSSNITGSSIFDFEADGKAEVVYADECFARVYSGTDGTVLYSRYHSSCTWLENPVVADVDGDFRAELVVPDNTACGSIGVGKACTMLDGNGVDNQFPGLRCLANTDCVSGICDTGLCRCTTSADCCGDKDNAMCEEFGTKCAPPPVGTPGAGNTCRANHPHGRQGIRVYEDAADRWVRSRTIWNQHAYAVTHVNEDGTIPKTSTWAKNWTTPKLNNFRQNVPGNQDATDLGDLTSQATTSFACDNGTALLSTPVCNRGTAPIGFGVSVGFYFGSTKVCSVKTVGNLDPGQCELVSCTWANPPQTPGAAVDVKVVPNDDGAILQCHTNNDTGLVSKVFCGASVH